jgi:hypothetical protein
VKLITGSGSHSHYLWLSYKVADMRYWTWVRLIMGSGSHSHYKWLGYKVAYIRYWTRETDHGGVGPTATMCGLATK